MDLLTLYSLTRNPLVLDAIRAKHDLDTPEDILRTVDGFLESQVQAYLTLFGNGGITQNHGNDPPTAGFGIR